MYDTYEINGLTKTFIDFVQLGYITRENYGNIGHLLLQLLPQFHKDIHFNLYIDLIYSMCIVERPDLHNPFIPKFISGLPEAKIDNDDIYLDKMYIIDKYISEKVNFSPAIAQIITEHRDITKAAYRSKDVPLYPQLQQHIAKVMLKLRLNFTENEIVDGLRVDFKLKDKILLFEGDKNLNQRGNPVADFQAKLHFLTQKYNVIVLNNYELEGMKDHQINEYLAKKEVFDKKAWIQ